MSDHDNDTCPHLVRASLLEAENARLKAEVERLTNENGNNSVLKEEWYLKCLSARAEVERLTRKLEVADNHAQCLEMVINAGTAKELRLKAEVERLRASSFVTAVPVEQYEQLIKAGDAMARQICILGPVDEAEAKAITAWNAAKEGKPSV